MKPRNEREREVTRLSNTLPVLTDAQTLWGVDNIVPHVIYTAGKKCWCSACGHAFEAKGIGETHECPHCHRVGKVEKSRKRCNRGFQYLQIITTCKGWQVVRYFLYRWNSNIGKDIEIETMTVMEKWCRPGQQTITLAACMKFMPSWVEQPYSEYSPLSVKNPSYWTSEWMKLIRYPRKKLLPIYYKCGYEDAMFNYFDAEQIFAQIFAVPCLESAWKRGNVNELAARLKFADEIMKFWPSVRIALRHGFDPFEKVNYAGNYFDYLQQLRFLHKDMRSPHYVAPNDWDDMHRRINQEAQKKREKIREAQERRLALIRAQAEEERMRQAKESKKSYTRRIKKFAGLLIVGNGLNIAPLMTIKEFQEEGAAMHHCVFSNMYYKKVDSLILSAKDDAGKRVETIEVSLKNWAVLQSHGINNTYTERHQDIIDLVMENMPAIQRASGRKIATA